MSALKKSQLVQDKMNQTEVATVNGNPHVAGTLGNDAKQRAEKHSRPINWRIAFSFTALIAMIGGLFPQMAMAEDALTTWTSPVTTISVLELIDPATLAAAVATIGATALVAAFTVGGGFRLAKRTYSWIMGKM